MWVILSTGIVQYLKYVSNVSRDPFPNISPSFLFLPVLTAQMWTPFLSFTIRTVDGAQIIVHYFFLSKNLKKVNIIFTFRLFLGKFKFMNKKF